MSFTTEQEVFAAIVQKAWEDADFKKELIANPVATIEALTGKKLNIPEGKTLVVKDQTDNSMVYINIPAQIEADVELSEMELDTVSGGIWDPYGNGGGCIPSPFPGPWVPTFPKKIL